MRSSPRLFLALSLAFALVGPRLFAAAAAAGTPVPEPAHPQAVPLWAGGAPGSEARKAEPEQLVLRGGTLALFNIHNPSVVPFLPAADKVTGAAVIISPGGGHQFLTLDNEGYDLAKWLAERGVAAFVLKYRLARDMAGNSPYKTTVEPVADGIRAVRLVRSRATEWGLNPRRIGVMGFSAGGVPALAAAAKFDAGKADDADPIERVSSRPDFQALIYTEVPAYAGDAGKDSPPAFMVVAFDDTPKVVPLTNLFLKYKTAGVPTELHVFNSGGHGFGVRDRPALPISTWPTRYMDWMGAIGMLKKP